MAKPHLRYHLRGPKYRWFRDLINFQNKKPVYCSGPRFQDSGLVWPLGLGSSRLWDWGSRVWGFLCEDIMWKRSEAIQSKQSLEQDPNGLLNRFSAHKALSLKR